MRPLCVLPTILFAGLSYGQAFRITSTTPNADLMPGDSVSFVVTAVRDNVKSPSTARMFIREYNVKTNALIRELTTGAGEANGVYRFTNSYRVPAYTCYNVQCPSGQTLQASELRVRLEVQATLQIYDNGAFATLSSAIVPVAVNYGTVSSLSLSTLPLNAFARGVRLTVKGAKFQAGKYIGVSFVKTGDFANAPYTPAPPSP